MYSCESFLDYAYEGDEALEAFHPIKSIQNAIIKLINFIQKMLNRIRGMRAVYLPEMYLEDFKKMIKAFSSFNKTIEKLIKTNNINDSSISQLEEAVKTIETSSIYGNFVNMDVSTFGKDDFVEIQNKGDIIEALNRSLNTITFYKTELNKTTEDGDKEKLYKKFANVVIRYHSLQTTLFSKILKIHRPLSDPKNVNKLGAVGTATPQMG